MIGRLWQADWRERLLAAYFNVGRTAAIALAAATIVAIGVADWLITPNLAIGFLYVIPVIMAAGFMGRREVAAMSAACAILRESFAPFRFAPGALPRSLLVFAAYAGAGLFVRELTRNRQLVIAHLAAIQAQVKLRRQAEERLRALIESSPAAILTADSHGTVLQANEAAHRLLGLENEVLTGKPLKPFLPILADVVQTESLPAYRTTMQCPARRRNGEVFYAYTWFSTYQADDGRQLAAIIVDASEDLRDREEQNLHQVLTSTRILVGAVAHEIRNLCGAIGVAHANLSRVPGVAANEDFRALGTLAEALARLASAELRPAAQQPVAPIDLDTVFEELRVVAGPAFEEADASIRWEIPPDLPMVWADRHGLLQVFLNLAQNSGRALAGRDERILTVSAGRHGPRVMVRFADTGAGIADPERLFQPFQPGANAAGLGLFVSRAIVRSFRGDLRLEKSRPGCCFLVELESAPSGESME